MTNFTAGAPAPAMELKPGREFLGSSDMPDLHVFVWLLAMLLGFLTILVAFSMAWRAHRKSKPLDGFRKAINLAITAVLASSLMNALLTIADWFDFVSDGTLGFKVGSQMLALTVAHQARLLGLSLGLASFGIAARILLPSAKKATKDSPTTASRVRSARDGPSADEG